MFTFNIKRVNILLEYSSHIQLMCATHTKSPHPLALETRPSWRQYTSNTCICSEQITGRDFSSAVQLHLWMNQGYRKHSQKTNLMDKNITKNGPYYN